jgi:integral membrane sensor domain MASE1
LKLISRHAYAMVVALLWTACALAMFALRDMAGAVLLVWLPSAIASAALFCCKPWQRAGVVGGLVLANIVVALLYNLGIVAAFGYAAANVSETVIVVTIAKWVVGRRPLQMLRLREMSGLMAAALAGSVVGALISFPFRPEPTMVQLGWWVLATSLGTAVCAPILLFIHAWWEHRKAGQPIEFAGGASQFAIWMAALFALDWWCCRSRPSRSGRW